MVLNWMEWKKDGTHIPRLHPTQKPVNLLKKLIEIFTDEGDVVIDPCCGSGSTLRAAKELNEALANEKPNCDVIICTPFIHLASVTPLVDAAKIGVGAENCADKESGAYTGEVSAAMVASTGAKYVILGHSERRAYYGETVEILEEKVKLALANGLTPIFCIGEVLEEREANKQNEVVAAQLASVFSLSAEDFSKIILAYEPVWAIGTGKTATPAQAQEIHAFIRSAVAEKYGKEIAENCSILCKSHLNLYLFF
jgi:triosephosphate isomerase